MLLIILLLSVIHEMFFPCLLFVAYILIRYPYAQLTFKDFTVPYKFVVTVNLANLLYTGTC